MQRATPDERAVMAAIARLHRADPLSAGITGIVGLTGLRRAPVQRLCAALLAAGRIECTPGRRGRPSTYRLSKPK